MRDHAHAMERKQDYPQAVEKMRREKDDWFATSHQSPLPHEEQHRFEGLKYFPVDPAFRFRVPLVPHDAPPTVTMQTSDGQQKTYTDVGHFEVDIEGQTVKIHAYDSGQGHGLFVPFRDATSGKETYGAGRYVEPHEVAPGVYELDLNTAYNPYCAYNEAFSCPFPPFDNWLKVPIRAGEKTYKDPSA